jgi:hypothetical protein
VWFFLHGFAGGFGCWWMVIGYLDGWLGLLGLHIWLS